ncbi:Flp family type IVb pilin [Nocardioides sp. URHA0020]|uniref:Flp family type IVb pilin n=1 Tax=Nocardioides sp. URHA0020 TaxID=1380392 RepID=UPI00055A4302|nr:Flp family type IVb pilin [Nocardioides sp. URHA0020]
MHVHDERGSSAVEYGLLVFGIAAVIASVVFLLGGSVRDTLFDPGCDELAGHLAAAHGGSTSCQN